MNEALVPSSSFGRGTQFEIAGVGFIFVGGQKLQEILQERAGAGNPMETE